jgi:AAA15 family ATPase/GTPase
LLFDEIEAHLHPKWQRVFLPALLKVVDGFLLKGKAKSVQFIVTTHAPLVLGSVESIWDASKDQLCDFDLIEGNNGNRSSALANSPLPNTTV